MTPQSYSLDVTALLLRDPQHPQVRAQLEQLYAALCQQERGIGQQRALVGRLLGVAHPKVDNAHKTSYTE